MPVQSYMAECLPLSFALEKRGSHTLEGTVETLIISDYRSAILAELEDNTGFLGSSASVVQTFIFISI